MQCNTKINANKYNLHKYNDDFIQNIQNKKHTKNKKNLCDNKKLTFANKKKLVEKKYNHIIFTNNDVKMKYSKEKYIQNISDLLEMPSTSENRLKAETIVKWCCYIRKSYISQMKKILNKCKKKVDTCLTWVTECFSLKHVDYMNTFCGQSKHTTSSELYFAETTYHILHSTEPIIMNSEDKAINILPIIESQKKSNKNAWNCSFLCKTEDTIIINDLKCCFEELLNCTLKNLHKFLNRIHKCNNKILGVQLNNPIFSATYKVYFKRK